MSVIQEYPRRQLRLNPVQAGRWLLVAVIGFGTLLVWWTTPRASTVEQLSLDLQAGRVPWVDADCRPEGGDGLVGFTVVSRPDFMRDFGRDTERSVCWRTTWGRAYAADGAELRRELAGVTRRQFGSRSGSDPLMQTISRSALDLTPGSDDPEVTSWSDGTGGLRHWSAGIVDASVLGLIVLMMASQQPRRGTRWGWFWVMITASGLGTIVYLLREAPWNRAAGAMPAPEAHQTRVPLPDGTTRERFSGAFGFVIALIVGVLLTVIVSTTGWVGTGDGDGLGDGVGDPEVRWSVVGPHGEVTVYQPNG